MQTTRSRTSEDKRSKEDTRCLRLQVGPNSVSLGGGELET
ncbi:hypothetical protein T4B_7873, partial [Trichinella pseudospiralis]